VSADAWGWLPYHYGRWTRKSDLGWVWSPTPNAVFKPGDVYWLYGLGIAGWGPLAPGEYWSPGAAPRQFLTVNTTWASFPQDAQVIDPAGFTGRPKEPLAVAVFRAALPSPAFLALRLEAVRAPLRVGSTHFTPVLSGTTFQDTNDVPPPPAPPVPPPIDTAPPSSGGPPAYPPDPGLPGPPMQTTYPVPVYTGIVVINPPDHPDYSRPNPNAPRPLSTPTPPKTTPPPQPSTTPTAPSAQTLPGMASQPPSGRPTAGPGIRPIEPPHEAKPEPKPPAGKEEAPRSTPVTPRVEAPGAAPATPRVEAPRPVAPRVEAPRPAPAPAPAASAPKVEAPKVEAKTPDTKTDTTSAKKQ
jgi:hypothetical protein